MRRGSIVFALLLLTISLSFVSAGLFSKNKITGEATDAVAVYSCKDLFKNFNYYFYRCEDAGHTGVCFNKYTGEYQGCSPISGLYCTSGNTYANQNTICSTETPRIMYWYGKVNQHIDLATGLWATDPDGTSGANIDQLTYCKKWYPNTASIRFYANETINTWKSAGNIGNYTSTKPSYECVQYEVMSCEESDGGLDYYTKGQVVGPIGPGEGSGGWDYCSNGEGTLLSNTGKYLVEWYCTPNGGADNQFYTCANGCSDGACIEYNYTDLEEKCLRNNIEVTKVVNTSSRDYQVSIARRAGTDDMGGVMLVFTNADQYSNYVVRWDLDGSGLHAPLMVYQNRTIYMNATNNNQMPLDLNPVEVSLVEYFKDSQGTPQVCSTASKFVFRDAPTSSTTSSCTDSDLGIDYSKIGYLSLTNSYEVLISEGDNIIVGGKAISIEYIDSSSVILNVDGVRTNSLSEGESYSINSDLIYVKDIFYSTLSSQGKVNIKVIVKPTTIFKDSCVNSNTLNEFYCKENVGPYNITRDCGMEGKVCLEGACVENAICGTEVSINITKAGNYLVMKGTTINANLVSAQVREISWALQGDTEPKVVINADNAQMCSLYAGDECTIYYGSLTHPISKNLVIGVNSIKTNEDYPDKSTACITVTEINRTIQYSQIYPAPFIINGNLDAAVIYGTGVGTSSLELVAAQNIHNDFSTRLNGQLGNTLVKDSELDSVMYRNWVVVGTPCSNSAITKSLNLNDCSEVAGSLGIGPGQAAFKVVENPYGTGKTVLLVVGYSPEILGKAVTYLTTKEVKTYVGSSYVFTLAEMNQTIPGNKSLCTETDGGKDYYLKGKMTGILYPGMPGEQIIGEESLILDVCSRDNNAYYENDNNSLFEFYCDGEKILSTTYVCPNGCVDGACVPECLIDYDCYSGEKCLNKVCVKEVVGKVCESGCLSNEKCYPMGYRRSGTYCSENNEFVKLQPSESICDNNFECRSNLCLDDQCVDQGLIKRFMEWLKGSFSKQK